MRVVAVTVFHCNGRETADSVTVIVMVTLSLPLYKRYAWEIAFEIS